MVVTSETASVQIGPTHGMQQNVILPLRLPLTASLIPPSSRPSSSLSCFLRASLAPHLATPSKILPIPSSIPLLDYTQIPITWGQRFPQSAALIN